METLTQTEKFSFLSPDFTTLWNYRREILTYLLKEKFEKDLKQKFELIGAELKFLVKGIMASPKSYTLWFHRQWILQEGLELEKDQLHASFKGDSALAHTHLSVNSEIMIQELMLCNKMLKMDERNFHCWNYRLWVVNLYLKDIDKRYKMIYIMNPMEDVTKKNELYKSRPKVWEDC